MVGVQGGGGVWAFGWLDGPRWRRGKGLEQGLTELVDAEKEKVKSALSGAVDDVQLDALG